MHKINNRWDSSEHGKLFRQHLKYSDKISSLKQLLIRKLRITCSYLWLLDSRDFNIKLFICCNMAAKILASCYATNFFKSHIYKRSWKTLTGTTNTVSSIASQVANHFSCPPLPHKDTEERRSVANSDSSYDCITPSSRGNRVPAAVSVICQEWRCHSLLFFPAMSDNSVGIPTWACFSKSSTIQSI